MRTTSLAVTVALTVWVFSARAAVSASGGRVQDGSSQAARGPTTSAVGTAQAAAISRRSRAPKRTRRMASVFAPFSR